MLEVREENIKQNRDMIFIIFKNYLIKQILEGHLYLKVNNNGFNLNYLINTYLN